MLGNEYIILQELVDYIIRILRLGLGLDELAKFLNIQKIKKIEKAGDEKCLGQFFISDDTVVVFDYTNSQQKDVALQKRINAIETWYSNPDKEIIFVIIKKDKNTTDPSIYKKRANTKIIFITIEDFYKLAVEIIPDELHLQTNCIRVLGNVARLIPPFII
ncbi:MAG: hypothetical protein P1P59_08115 [Treponemataceae bacterium]